MATNSSLKNQLSKKENVTIGNTMQGLLNNPKMKKRFEEILDKKAPQYMSSILNLYNGDTSLQKCEPMSVLSSSMIAATMDLPVDKNLGYAWIVPYKNKAQFQMGYKGYIQLALRTGQYKHINAIEIHEGELVNWNPLTEELEIDFTKKESDKIIGYAGYFELLNGFKKSTYWTKTQIENHRKKFSKSDYGWNKDFDAMAIKTVIRNMLSKWGILSIEMQNAYTADENIIKDSFIDDSENVSANIEDLVEADYTVNQDSLELKEEFEGTPLE